MDLGLQKQSFLDNRHPEYATLSADWIFWTQSYEGGSAYVKANHLFQFGKESQKNYEARQARADRYNFTRQILDLIIQYLFKEPPSRKKDQAGTAIQDFWEDVDGQGTGIDDFAKMLGIKLGMLGCCYVVVDKPAEVATTKLEQDQKRLKPYAYIVHPVDVLDVVFNNMTGKIEQILIREYTRGDIDLRVKRESDALQERFRLWFKDPVTGVVSWTLYKKDEKGKEQELDAGTITLDRVPIEMISRGGGKGSFGGSSLIGDVATLDRAIYNYNSLCDQILYDQTFSTLIIPWNGKTQEFYADWEIKLGTKSMLPYPADAPVPPGYISPDASQGDLIIKRIDQKTQQIFALQNLQDTMGRTINSEKTGSSTSPQSGIAKAYDFEKLNAGLGEFGDVLEEAEEQIAALVNLWEGVNQPIDEDLIDYPDNFNVKSMIQELMEYNMLSLAVNSETYRKILEKGLVKKATPKLEKQDYDVVMTEIDNSISPAELANQQAAAANKIQKNQPPAKA